MTTFTTLAELRTARNLLLQKTDFLMLPDLPLTEQERTAVVIYRQNLRDLLADVTEETVGTVTLPVLAGTNILNLLGE
jgi:hypothetical protein